MANTAFPLPTRNSPLVIPWPAPGTPGAFIAFDTAGAWRAFVIELGLDDRIPLVVRAKYARAQKLMLLAWIDLDLLKACELVALTTLELALKDRYGGKLPRRRRSFSALLRYMVECDGLIDCQLPFVAKYGGSIAGRLTGEVKPSLAQMRNLMAHGDPFDGLPHAGLLELVRDLITFAYRHYLAEHPSAGTGPGRESE